MDPPTPDVEVPEPIYNEPLLPVLDDPVLNTNLPLVPDVPAFGVVIDMSPLDVADDDPDVIVTAPPETVDADPALKAIVPP